MKTQINDFVFAGILGSYCVRDMQAKGLLRTPAVPPKSDASKPCLPQSPRQFVVAQFKCRVGIEFYLSSMPL